ncbi:MAG: replicative DNA helicase [Bacteroidales bacterium]|nr:replicative DNA helicase [Bacteroidales bacterium]
MPQDGAFKKGKGQKSQDSPVNLDKLIEGKKPPQNIEIEQAVLGALLVEPSCLDDALDELPFARCFYDERNAIIYKAIRELHLNHQPVDILQVGEKLSAEGNLEIVGGAQYLVELSQKVGAAAHMESHAKVVKQKFIQREIIKASYDIINTAFDDSVPLEDLSDTAQSKIFEALSTDARKEVQPIGDVISRALTAMEDRQKSSNGLSGVPSGFPTLDGITMGWQASDLIILAARPGVGKTSFAINMAVHAAKMNYPVAIFSLEMSTVQLANRMILSETGLESGKMKGRLKMTQADWTNINDKIRALSNAPLYLDDTPSLPVMELRSKVKKLVKQYGVRLVIVDYLQLMQGPAELRGMREQEVSAISRLLKATAKEHNVPIIALSQLSRKTVERAGSMSRPQLSDLRESGAIEQDADMVLFIHRPDYLGVAGPDDKPGTTQLIIAKNRNGEITDIPLHFEASCTQFSEPTSIIPDEEGGYVETPSKANSQVLDYGGPQFENNYTSPASMTGGEF